MVGTHHGDDLADTVPGHAGNATNLGEAEVVTTIQIEDLALADEQTPGA